MLEAIGEVFNEALWWCFNGPNYMLMQLQQVALNCFYIAAASGQKLCEFNLKKKLDMLIIYFSYQKQFLTYCYHVAYHGSYFYIVDNNKGNKELWMLESCVQLIQVQKEVWATALRHAVKEDQPALRDAIAALSIMLICHSYGGCQYSALLLSFYIMLSVKLHTRIQKELGNYNSCLFSIIQVVQLLVFHTSACWEKEGLGDMLRQIKYYYKQFLQ